MDYKKRRGIGDEHRKGLVGNFKDLGFGLNEMRSQRVFWADFSFKRIADFSFENRIEKNKSQRERLVGRW